MHELEEAAGLSDGAQAVSATRASPPARLRVALAICASPFAALRTADRLMQAGIAADDIAFGADDDASCLVIAHALDAMPAPRPALVAAGEASADAAETAPVAAKLAAPRRVLAGLDHFLTPDLVTTMKRHMMRGAVAVAVLVPSPLAEAGIGEILLRSSVDHVQFHDVG